MNIKSPRNTALALLVLVVTACSGGTGGTGAGGGSTNDISSGTVTNFGSIFVNGVEFSTTGATITRDDVSINESELRKGMVVEVKGSIASSTSGAATTVAVEEAVRGRVQSKTGTASAGTLVVLGQTVNLDDTTLYDSGVTFATIVVGDILEVHGHRRPDGSIAASFVERKTLASVFVVRGTVAAHSAGTQAFTIGALTVNYNGATIGDMPAPAGGWNGLFVEVKGTVCAGNPVCGTLTATKVEPEGLGATAAARAEIEGFVTAITALLPTADFTVGTQRVVTTGSTIFSGGLQSEIVLGVKLEAEGTLAAGILTASKISFRDNIKLESDVATISLGTNSLTLAGLTGITVTANSLTEFKGSGSPTSLNDFLISDHVRVRGRLTNGNTVIATEIEKRSADTRVILQGPVATISNPTVVILGVSVNTATIADSEFKDVNDSPIGRVAFFATVTPNKLVKARGVISSGTVAWDQIELED